MTDKPDPVEFKCIICQENQQESYRAEKGSDVCQYCILTSHTKRWAQDRIKLDKQLAKIMLDWKAEVELFQSECNRLLRRVRIAEQTCWFMADECFKDHVQPEGKAETDFVTENRRRAESYVDEAYKTGFYKKAEV